MATVQAKLKYLLQTKDIIKRKIQYFVLMPDNTKFRKYADYIGLIGTKFCAAETSYKYIPAPRIRTRHTVELPNITQSVGFLHLTPPRMRVEKFVVIPTIIHETEVIKLG